MHDARDSGTRVAHTKPRASDADLQLIRLLAWGPGPGRFVRAFLELKVQEFPE